MVIRIIFSFSTEFTEYIYVVFIERDALPSSSLLVSKSPSLPVTPMLWFQVPGFRFQVTGFRFQVPGYKFQVSPRGSFGQVYSDTPILPYSDTMVQL